MSIQEKTLVQFKNIGLKYDGMLILDNMSSSISVGEKIGLIGINGSGKSSLLKSIAGLENLHTGTVSRNCKIEYIPQLDLDLYRKKISLYEYVLKIHENWWEVLVKYENLFKTKIKEDRILDSLSGGELVKLNLAVAFTKSPEVIFFDEPTNHLDLNSINELKRILKETKVTFVIVSHDVSFLNDTVETIWEIENGRLNVYGGNYDFYRLEKDKKIQSQINQHEVAIKDFKKKKLALQKANKKFQKEQAKLKNLTKKNDRSLPKLFRNAMKSKMQNNFGVDKVKKEKAIEGINQKLKLLKIEKRKNVHLELNASQKSGLILAIENGALILPDRKELISDINMSIYNGERIGILGDNGSGKTTLVKQFEFQKYNLLKGDLRYGSEYKTLYVDQKYDLVITDLTIIENIQKVNKNINYENIRRVLGNLGFPDDYEINKKAKFLSGGEIARLAFAMATNSDIDLLILDEPTNNLDIETVEVIAQSLKEFKGTLIVISHNIHYLNDIGIEKFYCISDNKIDLQQR